MKFKLFTIISFIISISFVDPSFSQSSGMKHSQAVGMMHFKRESPCQRAFELNLSPEQVNKLRLIQQTYFRETQPLRTELFTKRFEIRELLTNPMINIESIRSRYFGIAEIYSKLEEKAIEYLINIRNILTEEQIRKWCPEKEFPLYYMMPHGHRPIWPIKPIPPEE